MDVHPTKNGINRYWPIPTSGLDLSLNSCATSKACYSLGFGCFGGGFWTTRPGQGARLVNCMDQAATHSARLCASLHLKCSNLRWLITIIYICIYGSYDYTTQIYPIYWGLSLASFSGHNLEFRAPSLTLDVRRPFAKAERSFGGSEDVGRADGAGEPRPLGGSGQRLWPAGSSWPPGAVNIF